MHQIQPSRYLKPLVLVVSVLMVVSVLLIPLMWLVNMSGRHDPVDQEQQLHFERGRELSREHRWQEAHAEYQAALKLRDNVYGVLGIAGCTDRLGDYPGALALYDRAIGMNVDWYQPYRERAYCIERNEGPPAVASWYAELEQREGDVAKYRYLLGSHHMELGRPAAALPDLLAALDEIMRRQRVTFTRAEQLAPPERIAEMKQNDLADLWPHLTYIAECYLNTSQPDEAYRWATRGVSLHQHISRRKGYCSPAEIEAGDAACRLLRARIHMNRNEWDAAERELAYAEAADDSPNRCAEFARELQQRRER